MNTKIAINKEQEDILQKVKEVYGEQSFEITELTFLFLIIDVLVESQYTDFDYLSKLQSLIQIVSDKIPDLKNNKMKVVYPVVYDDIQKLQRRQEYEDTL